MSWIAIEPRRSLTNYCPHSSAAPSSLIVSSAAVAGRRLRSPQAVTTPPWGGVPFLGLYHHFLNVFSEAPQAPPIGSGAPRPPPIGWALACGRSVVAPAVPGAGRSGLLPRRPPRRPLATKTWQFIPNIPGKRNLADSRLIAGLSPGLRAGLLSMDEVRSPGTRFSGRC